MADVRIGLLTGGGDCPGLNAVNATDQTFGFDTALQIATDAIDRLHTTAESHHRILVVEVMGRSAGWIALPRGWPAAPT